ncbi:hypothetical protein PABG_12391 [Paracoccidioides brasiliensis Pb03]|nr:hypothetical protein PABG_12391 [Paracoccidioides brasiliensis Pb03]
MNMPNQLLASWSLECTKDLIGATVRCRICSNGMNGYGGNALCTAYLSVAPCSATGTRVHQDIEEYPSNRRVGVQILINRPGNVHPSREDFQRSLNQPFLSASPGNSLNHPQKCNPHHLLRLRPRPVPITQLLEAVLLGRSSGDSLDDVQPMIESGVDWIFKSFYTVTFLAATRQLLQLRRRKELKVAVPEPYSFFS